MTAAQPLTCLLISSMQQQANFALDEIVRPAAAAVAASIGRQISVRRADDVAHAGDFRSNFYSLIETDDIILVNFDSGNLNVVYELALAQATGRNVIMLVEQGDRVPSNLAGTLYLSYSRTNALPARIALERSIMQQVEGDWGHGESVLPGIARMQAIVRRRRKVLDELRELRRSRLNGEMGWSGVKPDVFVSYSKSDYKDMKLLVLELRLKGFNVWVDESLNVGADFTADIEHALSQASVALVLWSPKSARSEWVFAEATIANEDRKMIPVFISHTELPPEFSGIHTLDVTPLIERGETGTLLILTEEIRRRRSQL